MTYFPLGNAAEFHTTNNPNKPITKIKCIFITVKSKIFFLYSSFIFITLWVCSDTLNFVSFNSFCSCLLFYFPSNSFLFLFITPFCSSSSIFISFEWSSSLIDLLLEINAKISIDKHQFESEVFAIILESLQQLR